MKQQPSQQETPSTAKRLRVRYLGVGVPYEVGMAHMRTAMLNVDDACELLLLEHTNTITTTRQHGEKSLLVSKSAIESRGIEVIETDRGGDVTFHGEGQLVGYLVMRLDPVDLVGYLRSLEGALLSAMRALGIENAITMEGKTGIWISSATGQLRKLIAIGIGVSRGVTRHGFALNVTTDLEKFTDCIVPCGLEGFGVTSLERELERVPGAEKIRKNVADKITEAFQFICD